MFFVLAIVIATIIVYAASLENGWTNWDDEGYVLSNDLVKSIDLKAIFSSFEMGNYHPVTVLVQAIEFHFFGKDASGFHTVSLLLHIINSLLLFYFIRIFFKNSIAAFIASLLFAIHPLHVESVSWVAAQKDLLYTGFYFAALIFYCQFVQSQRKRKIFYLLLVLAFILSNLSKGQAVTLPVILVLMDWYSERKISLKHLPEKIPLFAISVVFGVVAIIAQKQSASIQELEEHSFLVQFLFAFYALVSYLIHFIFPLNLSAYYPYPEKISGAYPWLVYTTPIIVFIVAYLVFFFRKKNPELVFGSLFFLVNIFLVLQLLPVGGAITADRYTYLSYAGLFIPLAFMIQKIWEKKWFVNLRTPAIAAAVIWILFLGYSAKARTSVWQNSEALWTDAIKKYPRLPNAHNNLGSYYQKHDQLQKAKEQFDIALNLQPDFAEALINRCDYFRTINKIDSALIDGNHAVNLVPENVDAHQNRGIAYAIANKPDSALHDFQFVIKHNPENANAFNNLGNLYMIIGKPDSAIVQYNQAMRVNPEFYDVLNNRGKAYVYLRNYQQAVADLTKAIEMSPDNPNNYYFRMYAYHKLGMKDQALADASRAQSLGVSVSSALMDSIQQNIN